MTALGLAGLVMAWLAGSVPVGVAATGLTIAGVLARRWARFLARRVWVDRLDLPRSLIEGDDLELSFRGGSTSRLPAGALSVHQPFGSLVIAETTLRRGTGSTVIPRIARGRYALGPLVVGVADPLGIERLSFAQGGATEILVRPRIPVLETLFSDAGVHGSGGSRVRLRRPSGLELHSVREHQEGESLRAVHWPSTARRGSLMVKEFDDAPRDDVVVVLDGDPDGVAGPPGSSSFDAAVRAAGAIVRAHAARGHRAALVLTGVELDVLRVSSIDREWDLVLDALAAVVPQSGRPLADILADRQTPAARAQELVIVSARAGSVADLLAARRRDGRRAGLVLVDAPTFVGASSPDVEPSLLRASSAGVAVAVVRADVDLKRSLEGALAGRASA